MKKIIRVALYIRCAIEEIDNQLMLLRDYVSKQDNCVLVKVYVDRGKEKKKFEEMMESAIAGEMDCVVTKDATRFSRHPSDTIRDIRTLKENNVDVVFLADGINTRDRDAELKIAIFSSIMQEQSRKMSERIKNGIKLSRQRKEMQGSTVAKEGCHYE